MTPLPDWARAHGQPLFCARIKTRPSDFVVNELLDIEMSGDGEHDWLWIEKTGANTAWIADQLARHAGVPSRDVGYAGLKDRHAVTRQWFSVRRAAGEGTDWRALNVDGVDILEATRHARKLKRGAHHGNSFRIALRGDRPEDSRVDERLRLILASGVPNYFGEQRFGRNGSNIELGQAVLDDKKLPRAKRSIGISALRSLDFNNQLSERVEQGTWNSLLPGDTANLDGTNSIFPVDEVDAALQQRCAALDVHPTGTMRAFESIGVKEMRRPLRMRVNNMTWQFDEAQLWLEFDLGRGSFATAVLREVVCLAAESSHQVARISNTRK